MSVMWTKYIDAPNALTLSLLSLQRMQVGGSDTFIYLIQMAMSSVLLGEFLKEIRPPAHFSGLFPRRNLVVWSIQLGAFCPVVKTVRTDSRLTTPTHQKTECGEW